MHGSASTGQKSKATNSVSGKKLKGRARKPPAKIQRPATNILESYDDPDYCSTSEDEDTRAGGRAMDTTLKEVSRAARHVAKPNVKVARCIGSSRCHKQWAWPRNQSRVLGHVVGCPWVPAELRHEAETKLAAKAGNTTSGQTSKRKQAGSHSPAGDDSGCSDGDKSGEWGF